MHHGESLLLSCWHKPAINFPSNRVFAAPGETHFKNREMLHKVARNLQIKLCSPQRKDINYNIINSILEGYL
ncbi:hypothetical protein EPIR_2491 [Erwinia piriflorinigrans CFBP 5888]|uniref:Uncharacterized protein n=1 Tax=Erwinia piriflorinigrans CFBP 5888 TaxID=1161919 RepID=V5Z9D1_9GAMM|nr:hypothetical protein EPIR_2491 [Erwinia piriflorinigrans CFBP 5888]